MEHAKRGRDKVPKSNMGSSILPLPKSGWIKLNVDGAMDSSMNIGVGSILQAELQAMTDGLQIVWQQGYKLVELECDNFGAI
ncbi:hypothetical protein GOBAR_DD22659 [Gossypium barbadense]|nr:hypothetical protein GOBAR_DD22659 [Gossypium barbadense]